MKQCSGKSQAFNKQPLSPRGHVGHCSLKISHLEEGLSGVGDTGVLEKSVRVLAGRHQFWKSENKGFCRGGDTWADLYGRGARCSSEGWAERRLRPKLQHRLKYRAMRQPGWSRTLQGVSQARLQEIGAQERWDKKIGWRPSHRHCPHQEMDDQICVLPSWGQLPGEGIGGGGTPHCNRPDDRWWPMD